VMYLCAQFAPNLPIIMPSIPGSTVHQLPLPTFELSFDLLFAKLTMLIFSTLLSKWMVDQTPNPSVDCCMQCVYWKWVGKKCADGMH